jgi:hypothetical protein
MQPVVVRQSELSLLVAVEGRQLLAKLSHYLRHHRIDAAKKMVRRNTTMRLKT